MSPISNRKLVSVGKLVEELGMSRYKWNQLGDLGKVFCLQEEEGKKRWFDINDCKKYIEENGTESKVLRHRERSSVAREEGKRLRRLSLR